MKLIDGNDRLLNMDEASTFLGVKKSTLYRFVMERQISVVKVGKLNRFRPQDLEQWIREHRQEARPNPLTGGAATL